MSVLGRLIDNAIAEFSPAAGARRIAARQALDMIRGYDAAAAGRHNGRRAPDSGANVELAGGLRRLSNTGHDLVRNNKYAFTAKRQIVAHAIGDGIAAQAVHSDPIIRQLAQADFDRWAESLVDGQDDWYGYQKLAFGGMVVGGDTLTLWKADDQGPDGRIEGLESDSLDESKVGEDADGSRDALGVRYDRDNNRVGYWLFDRHPGDLTWRGSRRSQLIPARHVDHLYERDRFGADRGVSWFAASAMTFQDIADIEQAIRLKKKVQNCLALILTAGEGSAGSPLLTGETASGSSVGASAPDIETLRPGMIIRPPSGTTASTLQPNTDGDSVDFIRQQLAAVSASMVPYHLMTGDVSQANYSSLRAAMLGHWAMLDDWQQNLMVPRLCNPAFARRMRRLALQTGEKRYLEVRAKWAMPKRRYVDPVKDLLGEVMEIRAGLKLLSQSLAERGINAEDHLNKIAELNKIIDDLKLALETDPRRLTDSGVLQAAAGYLSTQQGAGQANAGT